MSSGWCGLNSTALSAKVPNSRSLDRRGWSNWFLIAGVAVATTVGLEAGLLSFVRGLTDSPWPWKHTETILLCALSAALVTLVVWLTLQQHRLAILRAENGRMRDEYILRLRRHNDRLLALLQVSQTMSTETDVQAILNTITAACLQSFECRQVSLMVSEDADGTSELVVRSAAGHEDPTAILGSRQKMGEGVAGEVATSRRPLVLGAAPFPDRPAEEAARSSHLTAAMVVPILVRGELVGVLNLATHCKDAGYDAEDLRALQVFAENAGTCIRHAEQSHWMRQTIASLRTVR